MDQIEELVRETIAPYAARIEILVEELELLKISVEKLEMVVHILRQDHSHGNDLPTWDGPDSP